MKKSTLLICLLFTSSLIYCQKLLHNVHSLNDFDIPYEVWQLENGLTIIIHEDNSDPIVHVELTYHVGSNREQIGMNSSMMWGQAGNLSDKEIELLGEYIEAGFPAK